MAFTLKGDFSFIPELATDMARAAFNERLEMLGAGIIKPFAANFSGGGDEVVLPYLARPTSVASRRDLTSTAAASPSALSGQKGLAPILRRKLGPHGYTRDIFISGFSPEMAAAELGRIYGEAAAADVRDLVIKAALATMDALTTSTHKSDVWVASSTKANLTYARLATGKGLMGDAQEKLAFAVMHSDAWVDLKADARSSFSALPGVADKAVIGGLVFQSADGMIVFVVDDDNLKVNPGSGVGTHAKYKTLLFAPGSIMLSYAQNLEIFFQDLLLNEAPAVQLLGNYDVAVGVPGMKWGVTTKNPTAAQLGSGANWSEALSADHREVGIVEIVHNASAA